MKVVSVVMCVCVCMCLMVREGNIFLKLARLHYAHVVAGMFAVIMYFCHFVAILTDMHILKRWREGA